MIAKSFLLSPVTILALATGCQHAASAAGSPATVTPPPFASPPVLAGTPDVATLVSRVRPAVVNITTVHEIKLPQGGFGFPDFENLLPFFGHGPGVLPRRGEETAKQQALGSGFVVDAQGHVVTNAHVVNEADVVKVKLSDDREYQAKVVGKDERLDVAVLLLEGAPKNLPVASLGQSGALRVGDYVVAIGNPFGLGNTVTMGIVSAKGRSIGAGPYDDFIQTDASINPGNSGGPLFDLHGQVVGINTAINPQGRGIGFAIPIDAVKDVLPQLLATGHVARGRLGVLIQGMDEDLAKALGMDQPRGALVGRVESGSPAAKPASRMAMSSSRSTVTRFRDPKTCPGWSRPIDRVRRFDLSSSVIARREHSTSCWQPSRTDRTGRRRRNRSLARIAANERRLSESPWSTMPVTRSYRTWRPTDPRAESYGKETSSRKSTINL